MREAGQKRLALHFHILTFPKILQQIAPLEVLVGVDNGLQLGGGQDVLVLGALDLVLMYVLEYTVVGSG
jgi:hypothetical protein